MFDSQAKAVAVRVAWTLLGLVCVLMAQASFRYVTDDPSHYDLLFRAKYIHHLGVVWSHGVCATLALALGPFQFWGGLRNRLPRLHRTIGVIYMVCMLVGGLSSIDMGMDAHGGVVSKVGFCSIGVAWIITAGLAWRAAIQRQFMEHRRWMVRNFALTFGAVLLRVYLFTLQHLGYAFDDVYPFVTWAAWLPNVLLVEWWMRTRPKAPIRPTT